MKDRTRLNLLIALAVGFVAGGAVGYYEGRPAIGAVSSAARMTVETIPSSSGHIYLTGQVREGAILLSGDHPLTATQAIITDGGLTSFADRRHIHIVRAQSDGGRKVIPVDFSDIIDQGHLEHDPVLVAGDTIVVPAKLQNF